LILLTNGLLTFTVFLPSADERIEVVINDRLIGEPGPPFQGFKGDLIKTLPRLADFFPKLLV
jgi:hypothetical protein